MSQEQLRGMFTTVNVAVYVTCCYLFAALIVIYGIQFYKNRFEMMIKKRYYKIVFIINILSLPMICVTYPYIYINLVLPNPHPDRAILWSLTYPFCGYGMTLFTAIRFYLIYYDIQFLNSSKNLEWKKIHHDKS